MRKRSVLFAVAMAAAVFSAAASTWSAPSTKKLEACSLITDADAEQITKVPMKRQPVQYSFNCSYEPATPVPGPKTAVYLNVMSHGDQEDALWSATKNAVSGKSQPLPGLGDDAIYVRSTKTDAAIYVRKGGSQLILTCGGSNPDLFDTMKAVANKIVDKL